MQIGYMHKCRGCGRCDDRDDSSSVDLVIRGGIPIRLISSGESVKILRISGKDDVRRHLVSLGLTEGREITLISKESGDMIIDVKASKVAIDRLLAGRIYVTPRGHV